MKRLKQFNIRINAIEQREWTRAAKERDSTISRLIRRCMNALASGLIEVPEVPKPTIEDDKK